MSLITVIVPIYNVEKCLKRCIDSILVQTCDDFDLILIDDGSVDNSSKICDEYAIFCEKIHVIHKKNEGVSAARNTGIEWALKYSESKWVTFVDSDDWIHPYYLQFLLESVLETNMKISICNFLNVNKYEKSSFDFKLHYQIEKPENLFVNLTENSTVIWGKLYEKTLFSEIRFPLGKLHEDVFVTHRILFAEENIVFVDIPLYYYFYSNPQSITNMFSIKKLQNAVEGQQIRLDYFKENGFFKAYECEKNSIVYITNEIKALQVGIIEKDKKYQSLLRKKLRKAIKNNKIKLNEHIWIYELAYPTLMRIYWIMVAILRRFGIKDR